MINRFYQCKPFQSDWYLRLKGFVYNIIIWLHFLQYSQMLLFLNRLRYFLNNCISDCLKRPIKMRMFITSKNKYVSNYMKIYGTCSIPLIWYMQWYGVYNNWNINKLLVLYFLSGWDHRPVVRVVNGFLTYTCPYRGLPRNRSHYCLTGRTSQLASE